MQSLNESPEIEAKPSLKLAKPEELRKENQHLKAKISRLKEEK
jgi:hypothetical protein